MKIIHGLKFKSFKKQTVCTIGVFDGLHIGHKKIIDSLIKSSKKENAESIVITFKNHPDSVINPLKKQKQPITT